MAASESRAERLREAGYINQSLSALGNVVAALGQAELHRPHIPFRQARGFGSPHTLRVQFYVCLTDQNEINTTHLSREAKHVIFVCVHPPRDWFLTSVRRSHINRRHYRRRVIGLISRARMPVSRNHSLRDSKLTRILADSLGGDANAALIATVGPAPQNQVTCQIAPAGRGWNERRY